MLHGFFYFFCFMILIIGNPTSGGKRAYSIFEKLAAYLKKEKLPFSPYLTTKSKDYEGMRQAYNSCTPELVVSCGGDGTANDVINALYMHLNTTPVLILPAGSGNDFSKQIYGAVSPEKLFHHCKSRHYRYADIGKCNDFYFLNGIGIGFDGSVARQTHSNANKWLPTTLKYYLAIFRNIFQYREFEFNSNRFNGIRKAFMLAVANGACYGGGFRIAPGAVPDDGLLDVVEIGPLQPMKRPFYIPVVQKGNHLRLGFVNHLQCTDIEVSSTDGSIIPAHADGEIFEDTRFEMAVLKGVLKVPVDPF